MKEFSFRNIAIMAAVAACFTQIGAQLYALVVVASTVSTAPPRSFAILVGDYRYDSSAFWDTSPPIVFLVFVIALIANWNTRRRNLLLIALVFFVLQALLMMFVVEPDWTEMQAIGYRDEVDPVLQARAARWYALDWLGWAIGAIGGLALLPAIIRPPDGSTAPSPTAAN